MGVYYKSTWYIWDYLDTLGEYFLFVGIRKTQVIKKIN